jgi:hypothetical protein
MDEAADDHAPGGAITVALCGSWDHEGPCPFAPHVTGATRDGDRVRLRILFAAEPEDEPRARAGIENALRGGVGSTPDGGTASWRLLNCGPSEVRPDEQDHAERLIRS